MTGGVRITAGFLHGRKLAVPNLPGLRPTPAKVRQALFNILGPVENWLVLDLFSGSGLLALEAISRGAAHVTSIEHNHRSVSHLQNVRHAWQLEERWRIVAASVHAALGQVAHESFDLITADPPYEQGFSEKLPLWLDEFSVGCGRLVIEESARVSPDWPENWTAAPPRRYGDTCLHFLERGGTI